MARAMRLIVAAAGLCLFPLSAWPEQVEAPWIVYDGFDGPGKGKHIVLVSGDEEYRSEEAIPQLAKILSRRHGFRCTVLFAIDRQDGAINPEQTDNIPGLEALARADLLVLFARFRNLPDDQMKHIDDYVHSGRPLIGLRTSTHAFRFGEKDQSAYRHYDFRAQDWEGGFGRQVLGETWVGHHGHHGVQSTRGVIPPEAASHPIVRGVSGIWGPSDVYTVRLPLPPGAVTLVLGQVLTGMRAEDPPVEGIYAQESRGKRVEKTPNDPMMPVAWTRTFTGRSGRASRVFTTTMGAAVDLESEGLRRLLVNAAYWCLGMENQIPPRSAVELVGEYKPSFFGFGKHRRGLKPSDFRMER